jgi:hypothetical protein
MTSLDVIICNLDLAFCVARNAAGVRFLKRRQTRMESH